MSSPAAERIRLVLEVDLPAGADEDANPGSYAAGYWRAILRAAGVPVRNLSALTLADLPTIVEPAPVQPAPHAVAPTPPAPAASDPAPADELEARRRSSSRSGLEEETRAAPVVAEEREPCPYCPESKFATPRHRSMHIRSHERACCLACRTEMSVTGLGPHRTRTPCGRALERPVIAAPITREPFDPERARRRAAEGL